MKDWQEVAPPPPWTRGERVRMKELLNKPVEIYSAYITHSAYHDGYFATVNAECNGEAIWFLTSSSVLLDQISHTFAQMPYLVRIVQRKKYYTFATGKQAAEEEAAPPEEEIPF